jgi:hypothetical protein
MSVEKQPRICVCPRCGEDAEYNGAFNADRERRSWTWNVLCFACHLDKEAESHISDIAVVGSGAGRG